VMLDSLSKKKEEALIQTQHVGEKILGALNRPYKLGRQSHHSTPSIGITLFLERGDSPDAILKRADQAMYRAKLMGRNALCFFETPGLGISVPPRHPKTPEL